MQVGGVLAGWLFGAGLAGAQVNWTSQKSPINSTLQGVAYGAGSFVAVAASGDIALSADNGQHFAKFSPGLSSNLTCVAYGNGVFVAMGINGAALTSADGSAWQAHNTNLNFTPNAVIYAGGQFVAVGVSGLITTSTDGQTWVDRSHPQGYNGQFQGITYSGSQYVAVGTSGAIFTSRDATAWAQQTSGTAQTLYDTAFGGNNYCATGGVNLVLTSKNGTSWSSDNTISPSTASFKQVTWGSKVFVGVGLQGAVLTSPTGHSWVIQKTNVSNELKGIVLGKNLYVAVGTNGLILTSPVAKPAITKQPTAVSTSPGKTVTFVVKAQGNGKLTYFWTKNGTKLANTSRISGTTAAKLTIKSVVKGDGAKYQATVENAYGAVASTAVKLTVK